MAHRNKVFVLAALALLVASACGGAKETASEPAAPAGKPAPGAGGVYDASLGTAAISGMVKLEGAPPSMDKIKMNSDAECMKLHASPIAYQEVLVDANGALQNVFVYVKEGLENWQFPVPEQPAEIDQQGCMYTPHVMGIQVNQPLKIINSDPTLHNIHSYSEKNKPFNIGQPMKGMTTTKSFEVAEVMIKIRCDVHKWMAAYIGALEHPFYSVTGSDGGFSLSKLPPGQYLIEAWHERYGAQTQTVTVGDNESKSVEFTFQAN